MKKLKVVGLCFLSACIIFTFGVGIALAKRVSYSFINYSGNTIKNLYITGSSYRKWGPDLLGSSVLSNGNSVSLNYDNSVRYFDVKVVWMDGSDTTWSRLDYRGVWRKTLYREGSTFYLRSN